MRKSTGVLAFLVLIVLVVMVIAYYFLGVESDYAGTAPTASSPTSDAERRVEPDAAGRGTSAGGGAGGQSP